MDMLVVVSVNIGLGRLLSNVMGDMDWQMKLDVLKHPLWNFGIHHAKLGFNPFKRMLWLGTTSMSENVWIAMVPHQFTLDETGMLEDLDHMHGGLTCLSSCHQKILLMFLVYILNMIPVEDVYVATEYPDLEDEETFKKSLNVL